jgi:pimeloyl-ACP methyl ester carboxylesterase
MKPLIVRTGLVLFLASALSACERPEPEPAPAPQQAPEAAPGPEASGGLSPGEHAWTTADGNRMPYTVAGHGDVTVVLVHCWMCERSFWSEQFPVLARHYRVLAVDLPGHGEADAARERWTVDAYGEDMAHLIRGLDLSDVVLVGHSMGGPVSLRAAALAEGRVRGIVAVDTLHNAEFEWRGEQIEEYMRAFEADFVGTCGRFVEQMFPEPGAEEIMSRVRETSCRADRKEAGAALMRDFANIDLERWFREAGVPIRAINAAGGMPTEVEVNRHYADFDAVTLDGVGHYLHMTRPEQFNPLLLDAIEDILNPSTIAAL